jgi:cytochrome c
MKANPCNPCGGNPCGGGSVDSSRFKQPAGVQLASGSWFSGKSGLISEGEELWNDRTLGKSGLACSSCHINNYMQMQATFADPYPHYVAMPAEQGGVDEVNAAEMVQFCMMVPMATDPLPWNSRELASLAAFVESLQSGYKPVAGTMSNPCNPCGMKANPCGARRNPCNPCSR